MEAFCIPALETERVGMTLKSVLSSERLRELLTYDAASGKFWWRESGSGRNAKEAGFIGPNGYRRIFIEGREYKAHRLAWLYVHEKWPLGVIDHCNGIRYDNRLCNLRDVGCAENAQNSALTKGQSGARGVYQSGKRWRAEIKFYGRRKHLGYFNTVEAAEAAYLRARREFHSLPS